MSDNINNTLAKQTWARHSWKQRASDWLQGKRNMLTKLPNGDTLYWVTNHTKSSFCADARTLSQMEFVNLTNLAKRG